jgi:hypothetical protein
VTCVTHTRVEVSAEFIRELLRDQHPDLADLPVTLGARGWDNQLWRLGDDLAVRLPWATQNSDGLLLKEHAWVPAIAPRLPLPVPVPQRLGEPSDRFPRPWIVTTWVPGEPADRAPATRDAEAADTLAAFLSALHQPAPVDAPAGRGRGGPLADGAGHAGDPACDLAACWILLPDGVNDRFHEAYTPAVDAATLRRARGHAVCKALVGILIGDAGVHGRPGGKPTWGPPARASLQRLTATVRS